MLTIKLCPKGKEHKAYLLLAISSYKNTPNMEQLKANIKSRFLKFCKFVSFNSRAFVAVTKGK